MRSVSKWLAVFVAVVGLGFGNSASQAESPATQPAANSGDSAAVGNITGTVMKDGKPVAGAQVGLIDGAQIKARVGKGAKNKGADNNAANAAPAQRQRPTPVTTTTTDSEGKFTLNDVKVGEYMIVAMVKGEGRGRARASVSAGQTATVEVQMIPRAAGAGKAAKAGAGKAAKLGKGVKGAKQT